MLPPIDILSPEVIGDLISRIAPTGENANGKWLRIGDWQACWRRISASPTNGATSHLYPSAATVFAQPFLEPPEVWLQAVEPPEPGHLASARAARYIYRDIITTTNVRVMVLAQAGDTFESGRALITNILAAGRWR